MGYDRRQRLQPAARRFAFAHEHERAGSSVKSGGVARGDGRALIDGLQLREPFKRRVGARRLVFGDHDVALFGVKDVGLYLVLEFTGLEGLLVEHLAAVGPFVLHFAADAVLESDLSRLLRARFTGVGAGHNHDVFEDDVAETLSPAQVFHEVGDVAHVFRAAANRHLGVAEFDRAFRHRDGYHRRAAGAVDGGRVRFGRHARGERYLTGDRAVRRGHVDADVCLFNVRGIDRGALHGLFYDE